MAPRKRPRKVWARPSVLTSLALLCIGLVLFLQPPEMSLETTKQSTTTKATLDPTLASLVVDCSDILNHNNNTTTEWIDTIYNFQMQIHNNDAVSDEIRQKGCYECDLVPILQHALESHKNALFLDIGANLGLYSFVALAQGHDVIALEPVRASYTKLCGTVVKYNFWQDHLTLVNRAASNQIGNVSFQTWPGNWAGMKMVNGGGKQEGVDYAQTIRLNDWVNTPWHHVDQPLILKMDVEGAECRALLGALEYLRPLQIVYAQIEFNLRDPVRRNECQDIQQVVDFFTEKHMQPYLMNVVPKRPLDANHAWNWKSPKAGGNFDVGWYPMEDASA